MNVTPPDLQLIPLTLTGHHDVQRVWEQDGVHGGQDERLQHVHPDTQPHQVPDEAQQHLEKQQSRC